MNREEGYCEIAILLTNSAKQGEEAQKVSLWNRFEIYVGIVLFYVEEQLRWRENSKFSIDLKEEELQNSELQTVTGIPQYIQRAYLARHKYFVTSFSYVTPGALRIQRFVILYLVITVKPGVKRTRNNSECQTLSN
jgi:hypothetical protein